MYLRSHGGGTAAEAAFGLGSGALPAVAANLAAFGRRRGGTGENCRRLTRFVKGISGRVDKVYGANKAILQSGNLRLENQNMTAFDTKPRSDGVGTEISGFVGFVLLRFLDIKIDYRDALSGLPVRFQALEPVTFLLSCRGR